jgi:D-alanyl-D-alanine carboxypeptidase
MLSRRTCILAVSVLASIACSSSTTDPSTTPAAVDAPDAAPVEPAVDAAPAPTPNALADAIDALFKDSAAKDVFSGTVIVVDGGKQVLAKGYGAADRIAKRDNTADTILRVGSMSKQFAASALLALVSDGKLALTDPVSKFFPDYPAANLVMDGVPVTLHHLISHTSGLPDPASTTAFKKAVWTRPIAPSEQVAFAQTLPLIAKPGTVFAYLNYNFLLAALIVEKTAGVPYESFLRTRFFDPLAMNDTGTVLPVSDSSRIALGYADFGSGKLTSFSQNPSFKDPDVTVAFGSGQIFSTIFDLAKWDRALKDVTVLPAAQRDLLFTPNLSSYGYGWVIQKKNGVAFEWHNGALSPLGFASYMIRVPSKDRFVAYLANREIGVIQPFETKVEALAIK